MDTVSGKTLKLHNWPDGKIIGIAKRLGEQLAAQGIDRETILAAAGCSPPEPRPISCR